MKKTQTTSAGKDSILKKKIDTRTKNRAIGIQRTVPKKKIWYLDRPTPILTIARDLLRKGGGDLTPEEDSMIRWEDDPLLRPKQQGSIHPPRGVPHWQASPESSTTLTIPSEYSALKGEKQMEWETVH